MKNKVKLSFYLLCFPDFLFVRCMLFSFLSFPFSPFFPFISSLFYLSSLLPFFVDCEQICHDISFHFDHALVQASLFRLSIFSNSVHMNSSFSTWLWLQTICYFINFFLRPKLWGCMHGVGLWGAQRGLCIVFVGKLGSILPSDILLRMAGLPLPNGMCSLFLNMDAYWL